MADVKWIKLATELFDNRKIRQIESLPDGDSLIVIWVKLLCLAGNINDSGFVYFTKEIPYTDQMLSTQFHRPIATIQMAISTFEQFGMIEIIDNVLHISNWEKYQNVEGMEKIREQTKKRVREYRERQKVIDCNVTVTQCNATDKNKNRIEEDIDKDKEKSKKENTRTLFNRLIPEYSISEYLSEKLSVWITYKIERKESYKEQGMKSLLKQVENKATKYGDEAICNLIDDCMANNWKGIIWDKLNNKSAANVADGIANRVNDVDNW